MTPLSGPCQEEPPRVLQAPTPPSCLEGSPPVCYIQPFIVWRGEGPLTVQQFRRPSRERGRLLWLHPGCTKISSTGSGLNLPAGGRLKTSILPTSTKSSAYFKSPTLKMSKTPWLRRRKHTKLGDSCRRPSVARSCCAPCVCSWSAKSSSRS